MTSSTQNELLADLDDLELRLNVSHAMAIGNAGDHAPEDRERKEALRLSYNAQLEKIEALRRAITAEGTSS
jgi:hypothetical protein